MSRLGGIVAGLLCLALAGPASSASALTAADFADWTAITDTAGPGSTATGRLHGVPLSLAGNVFSVASGSNTSGTYTGFSGSAFTPSLATSDVVEIGTGNTPFTLQFGYAVTNPVVHVAGMGGAFGSTTLRFPAGTQIIKLSGSIAVTGREVGQSAASTANGTFRLNGTFGSTSFEAGCEPPDPMSACGGSISLHVAGAAPPAAADPPRGSSPPPGGSSCPAGTSAGVSCQAAGGGTTITGTAGNDTIVAPPGAKVSGGAGNDRIDCRAAKAACSGGAGKDQMDCGAGPARCEGGAGNDKLACKETKGRCAGDTGTDTVQCQKSAGQARCSGGSGNDKVLCRDTKGKCTGDAGPDTVNCEKASAAARCSGGPANDKMDCRATKGSCAGDGGDDQLDCRRFPKEKACSGGGGKDQLDCSTGRARCEGGAGKDSIRGKGA